MSNRIILEQAEGEPATVNMVLTPFMEGKMKEAPFFLEVEMLQGNREELPDGIVRYSITVADEGKVEILREFILRLVFLHQFGPGTEN